MKNNDIIKKSTFHSTLSKRFGSKPLPILEKVIMLDLRRKIFPENCFYKFYTAVILVQWMPNISWMEMANFTILFGKLLDCIYQ